MGGNTISVPLGSYVFAYNATGTVKNYGDQVDGEKLNASYAPGSYPYGFSFLPGQTFECRGYNPVRATTLWQRVA